MTKRAMLVILDGYGNNPRHDFNATLTADAPFLEEIFRSDKHPVGQLAASGLDVGLPEGQMGNSEVGHMNIGAGRIVYQDLTKISQEVKTGEFFRNPVLTEAMQITKERGGALHLLGLLSNGGVHSHQEHMLAIVSLAKQFGLTRVYLHAFMDGRDTSPTEGKGFLLHCMEGMKAIGLGEVATISGRYWSMDRDKRWERTKRGFNCMVHGVGEAVAPDGIAAMFDQCYAADQTDEFLEPHVVVRDYKPVGPILSNDTVIHFNFRADRARQMSVALTADDFSHFDRGDRPENLHYVTMTRYAEDYPFPVAYPKEVLRGVLGEVVSEAGLVQIRTAETEKYAHVTYFLNGGEEKVFAGEERLLIPSPKVATYDLKPEMAAFEVTNQLVNELKERQDIALVVINYANCDMVGHTGVMEAAVKAVEAVNTNLERLTEAWFATGGDYILVTADHGNAEQMVDYETGEAFTEHTLNVVPLALLCRENQDLKLKKQGRLADLAPTLLTLMELPIPSEMTGECLLTEQ